MNFPATQTQRTAQAILLAGVLTVAALPVMADPLPAAPAPVYQTSGLQPVTQGNVSYITGGIGEAEKAQLQAQSRNYNLYIINSSRDGAYASDTSFIITGHDGHPVLNADNTGPLFYANLPAGQYKVEAMNGEQREARTITVAAHRQSNLHFIWSLPTD